jgi:putative transposase
VRHQEGGAPLQPVYHVWFATKSRKRILEGDIEQRIQALIAETAARYGIRLLALETMIDHVHILICLHDGQNLSKCMNLLKGTSSRRIFQEMPDIKLDAHIDHFWQKRFGSKLVPPGAVHAVRRYIETQKDRPEKYDW